MIDEKTYFDYLYQALASNGLIPDSIVWRKNMEFAVSFLEINTRYIERLKDEYSVQFSEIILVNSTKNILLCKGLHNPISKELCAASVYFSLLGCVIDFWIDSKNENLRNKGLQKLSWNECKKYFQNFEQEKIAEDIVDELFMIVENGIKIISKDNPKLYKDLLILLKATSDSEIIVAQQGNNVRNEVIFSKSVLFVKIALMIAVGNKTDLNEEDYYAFERIGLLYAYIDELMDVYEDINNHQGNTIVKRLYAGESYKIIIDNSIQEVHTLLDQTRDYFGEELSIFIFKELSEWVFTNKYLTNCVLKNQ